MLKATHITRSRYVHQVSACALYILQKKAYKESIENQSNAEDQDFTTWVKSESKAHPQFMFWTTALDLQLLVLEFVKATREGNFPVYVEVLSKIVPWMFALNLTNYSRWLPVHIRDLVRLEKNHPSLFAEFTQGKFVVQKSQHRFSMIALDQNHEQENEIIKGDGGAVGLTESPTALRRWMISGPEIARLIREFESTFEVRSSSSTLHHEQVPFVQKNFAKDVKAMVTVLDEYGNPFLESSKDLIVLDSKEIMPDCVVQSVYKAKELGETQYNTYVEERLNKCTSPISDTIQRNKLPLFGTHEKTASNKTKNQVANLKSDCNLFSRLYIACQAREGNLQEFFKHENQSSPPSLSCGEKMRSGQKSELIESLQVDARPNCPAVDVKILDAAAIVNMISPGKCKTFSDYAQSSFVPYIIKQAENVQRVDLVWDRYLPNSLKRGTREARGAGTRRRVCDSAAIPSNWKSFLRSDENKQELFHYLANITATLQLANVVIISTVDVEVISSTHIDKEELTPCNHEEADTRIFVHARHASNHGLRKIMIRTVDTDVVILAIANVHKISVEELWVAFGVGKHLKYLPIHKIASTLTKEQCESLPFFHAVTGCDNVSFFAGVGKKTAFQAWRTYPEATPVFQSLSSPQDTISEQQCRILERFVIIMYSRTCPHNKVNDARQALFSQGTRSIDHIPPTQTALEQHIKRAAYQAGQVWGQSLQAIQELPSPLEWGWEKSTEAGWIPKWTTLPEASKICNELIRCGCKKACRGLCKCTKSNLPCTALCNCSGNCYQE